MRLTAVNYLFLVIISIEASFWIAHTLEGSPDYEAHMACHLDNTKGLCDQQPDSEHLPQDTPTTDEDAYDEEPVEGREKKDPTLATREDLPRPHPTARGRESRLLDESPQQTPKKGKHPSDAETNEQGGVSFSTLLVLLALALLLSKWKKTPEEKKAQPKPRPEQVGIIGLDVAFPRSYVKQSDLEQHDGVSAGKYTIGLGQIEMAVPEPAEDATSLALTAVQSLMDKHRISPDQIGRLEVGSESLNDYSKSLKTSLLELFGDNTSIEGVTSLNACYGGTAALFNSVAWVESSAWDGRLALVVAVDIAVYAPGPARPTGGGAAVAMLVGPGAILSMEPDRATYAANKYDFYKPCRNPPSEFPIVDGHLSNACYLTALDACYKQYAAQVEKRSQRPFDSSTIDFMAFHAPYNKLVRKSFARLSYSDALRRPTGSELSGFLEMPYEDSLSDRELDKFVLKLSAESFDRRVAPSTGLGRRIGNCYTASLYCSLASLIQSVPATRLNGKRITLFSYGSGAVASMFSLRVNGDLSSIKANLNLLDRLADRNQLSPVRFNELLAERSALYGVASTPAPPTPSSMSGGSYFVSEVDHKFRRSYSRAAAHTVAADMPERRAELLCEFSYDKPALEPEAPVQAVKPSRLAKASKILEQLSHPVECAALAKFLWAQKANKKQPKVYSNPDERFCFQILNRVSRSFAAVIEGLCPKLRLEVCVFYLVLRALDTVEDDMSIPEERKKAMLRDFANHLRRPATEVLPIVHGYGDTEDYRELLRKYDCVLRVFQRQCEPGAQDVIEEITIKMAEGMADFVGATRVGSVADYELYCHYVAGLVGIGLSKLWAISPEEGAKWSSMPDRDFLSNEMGLFLQKTNITRDYREDIDVNRLFWPKEVWSQYAEAPEEFKEGSNPRGVHALNHMITDALEHVPHCLTYLELLSDPAIFAFCAIPQVMAIATLNKLYNNPNVLQTEVKIRKGLALSMMNSAKDLPAVKAIFYSEASELRHRVSRTDPSAARTIRLLEGILQLTAPEPSPLTRRVLSGALDCSLLASFGLGVHRLSVCSAAESCELLGADGLALLVASGAVHLLRVCKGDKWVAQALGYARPDKADTPPSSPRVPDDQLPPAPRNIPVRAVPAPPAAPAAAPAPEQLVQLPDHELAALVAAKTLPMHALESLLQSDCLRAASVRRLALSKLHGAELKALPLEHSVGPEWYAQIHGANCEAVVGYLPLPVGVAGPLTVDSQPVLLPLATTEGALVASTNRGCKALNAAGVCTAVLRDGISRAPVVRVPSLSEATALVAWLESEAGFQTVKAAFEGSSSYARLSSVAATVCGKLVYLRFVCATGDAMGMNMVSKGAAAAIEAIQATQPQLQLQLVSLSGNACADKKPAAVNWVQGRGKSVVAEATIPAGTVQSVLKVSPGALVQLNTAKNLVGSAVAGALGGSNAHASNVVTAMFLATGQDPAQNVESSSCLTFMELTPDGDLYASVTLPSMEVGTVGGGTTLPAQRACLKMMGVDGAAAQPGENATRLAKVIASAVLAGELSLLSALCSGELVKSHMNLNRK